MRIRTLHGPLGPLCSIQDRLGSHPSAVPARGLEERKLGSWAGSPPLPQTIAAPAGGVTGRGRVPGLAGGHLASTRTVPWPLGMGHSSPLIPKPSDKARDFSLPGHLFLNGLHWPPPGS